MSTEHIILLALLVVVLIVEHRRANREFIRGYRMGLDHVEFMTRPNVISSYELPEALAVLRRETQPSGDIRNEGTKR